MKYKLGLSCAKLRTSLVKLNYTKLGQNVYFKKKGQVQLICDKLDWPSWYIDQVDFCSNNLFTHLFLHKSPRGLPMRLSFKFVANPPSCCWVLILFRLTWRNETTRRKKENSANSVQIKDIYLITNEVNSYYFVN